MSSKKEAKKEKEKLTWQQSVILYLHDLLYMLVAVILIFLIFFRIIVVSGDSMYQTLWDGDYVLLVNNLFAPEPDYGDIVVISKRSYDNGKPIVKRVIATEGQTVDIDFESGIVYVDGLALEEPYINSPTYNNWGSQFPLTVADNCIFVLGDNRGVSRDSRDPIIGQVDKREVLGKAIFLMIPGTNHGREPQDMDRMGAIE